MITPEIIGMSIVGPSGNIQIRPVEGISNADKVFDELAISVVKPNPKLLY